MRLLTLILVATLLSTSFAEPPISSNSSVSEKIISVADVGRNSDRTNMTKPKQELRGLLYRESQSRPKAEVDPIVCRSLRPSDLPEHQYENVVSKTADIYSDIRCQLSQTPENRIYLEGSGPDMKLADVFLIALIIQGEFGTVFNYDDLYYLEALEAVSYEYHNKNYERSCGGHCQTIQEQMSWLMDVQSFRQTDSSELIRRALHDLSLSYSSARKALAGYVHGYADSVIFGNYTNDSTMAMVIAQGSCADWMKDCQPAFTAVSTQWNAVVLSARQNLRCRAVHPSCVGW